MSYLPLHDGSYRAIVGPEYPGVENWIDTTGHTRGGLLWRFVSGDAVPGAARKCADPVVTIQYCFEI
jgi:hypothetical protein